MHLSAVRNEKMGCKIRLILSADSALLTVCGHGNESFSSKRSKFLVSVGLEYSGLYAARAKVSLSSETGLL